CRATYQAFQAGGFTTDCGGVGVSDLGCLADGTTSVSGVVVSTGELSGLVKWYKFCLPADATDNAGIGGQFLDLDTEGSQASFALGLYDGDTASASFGDLIAFDRASGSGNNSQLSFGM